MDQAFLLLQLPTFLLSFVDSMRHDDAVHKLHADHGPLLDWHEEKIQQLQPVTLASLQKIIGKHVHEVLSKNFLLSQGIAKLVRSYLPLARASSDYEDQSRKLLLRAGGQQHTIEGSQVRLDTLWLPTQGADLEALPASCLLPIQAYAKGEGKATVIIFPGNGSCYEECHYLTAWYLQRGFNVLLFNYRGSVKSQGTPCEEGYYADAHAAYGYLQSLLPCKEEDILFHGVSLGGSVALELLQSYPRVNLLLDQTFSSIAEIVSWQAQKFLPQIFGRQFPWVYKEILLHLAAQHVSFDNFAKIPCAEGHVAFVRATQDQIIPSGCVDRLYARAKNALSRHKVDAAGPHCVEWFLTDAAAAGKVEGFLVETGLCYAK